MRIVCIFVMKQTQDKNSIFLQQAYELGFLSWYQRSFYKEGINFGARTVAQRTQQGSRTQVKMEEQKAECYIYNDAKTGLQILLIADSEYPSKVAFLIIQEILEDLRNQINQMQLDGYQKDTNIGYTKLDEMIKKYQDPKEADKLYKLESNLKDVKEIIQQTLENLLKRGEDLDQLMAKSKDISTTSYNFYKQARKTNQKCCSLY